MSKPIQHGELEVPVKNIMIGERIRDDLGDLRSLQMSMELKGILVPPIVESASDGKYKLIDGERRLQCCKRMGLRTITVRLFSGLDEFQKKEIELELCIKQKQLSYAEEARAVREIVRKRQKDGMVGNLSRFGGTLRKKDIADELSMTPAALSQCLAIANAMDEHPELETLCTTKRKALTMISSGQLRAPHESMTKKSFEESFVVSPPLDLVKSIQDKKIVDLFILHPEIIDKELVKECNKRLKFGGSMIIFIELTDLAGWLAFLKSMDLAVHDQPYMWNIKNESRFVAYLWVGKNRSQPMRLLSNILSFPRSPEAMSLKAKSPQLTARIIKCCTERGAFIVVPDCEDIETIKTCYDLQVNVRAGCADKILHDRLIMISGR